MSVEGLFRFRFAWSLEARRFEKMRKRERERGEKTSEFS